MQDPRFLIVKGKYRVFGKFEHVKNLKVVIMRYMGKKGFQPEDIDELFLVDGFYTMNFRCAVRSVEIPFQYRLLRKIGLINKSRIDNYKYYTNLEKTRDEYPFTVKFCFKTMKLEEKYYIHIEVTSIPAVYYKIYQKLIRDVHFNKADFSNISFVQTDFIEEVMSAIWAEPIEQPRAIQNYIESDISKKLDIYNFKKISNLLIQGKTELEKGGNSIGYLLGAIENFLSDAVSRTGNKPAQLHQPEKISKY